VRLPWEDGGVCETPRMGGRRLVALQEGCLSVEVYTTMPAPRDSTLPLSDNRGYRKRSGRSVASGAVLLFPDNRNPTVYQHLKELYILNERFVSPFSV
jgi:hypothetical protein